MCVYMYIHIHGLYIYIICIVRFSHQDLIGSSTLWIDKLKCGVWLDMKHKKWMVWKHKDDPIGGSTS